ncbi:MAG: tetratricopeptide repeat protein [Candidatus Marinimicrobia bacterium]|jgi:tetratricopeptide (TPR) repeat protein|nr:tetratricopeptide repeat protein [Candidatus Neomarinimicrobiota bacterium]MBT4359493.1 tetratricopeptide repeat protein [Candidatus Neomarinimicrobiota bacterium]MBT4715471.1 tetratricopeptide repeat protein [Candidatus Neomarinimicrobiota bacterium]MBT4946398.1 tetratricopeptide repeat protein [Candidatus Neomarinimicrobiota bacterium]MBT5268859.1 tetratricopeptide repeat protein [Candidatus Neomarinimicrobiota bacterium]
MKQSRNLMIWVVGLLLLTILGCDSTDMTSAKVYLQQKNYEKAEEMLLAATDKEPTNSEPSFLLATEIYSRTKTWDKVSEFLNKSASIDAKFAEKIKHAREKYWVDNFNFGAKGYNALIKGEAKDEDALYASTEKAFINCISLNPEKPEAYSTLAQVYLFKEEFEKGKEYMVLSVEKNPKDITSLVNLGLVYFREESYDDALVYMERALEVDPTNLNAIKQIAFVYDAKGEKETAATAYINAIEMDPNSTDLHYNLGVLYFQQEKWQDAANEFIRVTEISPVEADALFNAGLAFGRMKKFKDGEKYLELAYELTPESLDVVHELKMTYYQLYGTNDKKFKEMEAIEKSLK